RRQAQACKCALRRACIPWCTCAYLQPRSAWPCRSRSAPSTASTSSLWTWKPKGWGWPSPARPARGRDHSCIAARVRGGVALTSTLLVGHVVARALVAHLDDFYRSGAACIDGASEWSLVSVVGRLVGAWRQDSAREPPVSGLRTADGDLGPRLLSSILDRRPSSTIGVEVARSDARLSARRHAAACGRSRGPALPAARTSCPRARTRRPAP